MVRPVLEAARARPRRVVCAEGEDERVLRATQVVVDEGLARSILIGRPEVIAARIARADLRIAPGSDFELVDPVSDPRFRDYWMDHHRLMGRQGVTPELAKSTMRRSMTAIAAMMVRRGDADAMLCGLVGRYGNHLQRVADVIGLAPGARTFATVNALMLPEHTLFIADTFVNEDPSAEELGEIALLAAGEVRRRLPLEAGGMRGAANLLVMPNLDAANILSNVLKMTGGKGITVGPMLLGAAEAVHILEPSCTVRRVVNMTALASADVRDAGRQAGADPV